MMLPGFAGVGFAAQDRLRGGFVLGASQFTGTLAEERSRLEEG